MVVAYNTSEFGDGAARATCSRDSKHPLLLSVFGLLPSDDPIATERRRRRNYSLVGNCCYVVERSSSKHSLFLRSMALDSTAGHRCSDSVAFFLGASAVSVAADCPRSVIDF